MKTGQRPDSNSDYAWMVPNKPGIGRQGHKHLGPESWLCPRTKTVCWAKASEVLYHPVTQTALLGSGQLPSLVTEIELSSCQSPLMRIGLRVFFSWPNYRKKHLPFCWDISFLFISPNYFRFLKPPSPPLPSLSPPSCLCWADSLLHAPSYSGLVPYAFSTSSLYSGVILYFLCISGEMNIPTI